MSFSPATRDWSMQKLPMKASTNFDPDMFVYNDNTDNVPVTSTTQNNVLGIILEDKASTDSAATKKHILVPNSPNSLFYGDVTGTLTAAMEGDAFDFHTDGLTVAQAASTYDTVTLVKFISASKGIFKLNYTFGIEN